MAFSSVTGFLMPGIFHQSAKASGKRKAGSYPNYDQIYNATYPFSLEPLPYEHNALEPAIDAKTMEIHHGRHHQGYINNLNNALENHFDLQEMTLSDLVSGLNELPEEVKTAVQNHGGGHLNHVIFWNTMSPNGSSATGSFAEAVNRDFGSLGDLKSELKDAAGSVFGSGWAWVAAGNNGQLSIVKTPNQDNPLTDGLTPLTGVDVWEHAYYLNYQNLRGDYVDAWLDLVHWEKVSEIYEENLAG